MNFKISLLRGNWKHISHLNDAYVFSCSSQFRVRMENENEKGWTKEERRTAEGRTKHGESAKKERKKKKRKSFSAFFLISSFRM